VDRARDIGGLSPIFDVRREVSQFIAERVLVWIAQMAQNRRKNPLISLVMGLVA
jgi:hypothetical protein